MTTFRIDADNNITAVGASEQIEESGAETETFSSVQELTALAEKWSAARLVEIWSSLPGVQPVQRFTNRQVATTRIWKALQRLAPSGEAETGPVAVKRPSVWQEGAASSAKTAWRQQQDNSCDRSAATAPGGNAAGDHESDRLANS
jgi:hypothetical protein